MTKTDKVYAKAGLATNALVVFCCLCLAGSAAAQSMPTLNNDQRGLLAALLTAVETAPPPAGAVPEPWQTHLLRASDGSHYVAFSVASSLAAPINSDRALIYVRLSLAPESSLVTMAARSSVREWLAGSRIDPRLVRSRRGFAVGDMPAMGAATAGGGGAATVGSADLQIMGLQRERERQRKEQEQRERKASLESAGPDSATLLPFEDFDLIAPERFADGTPAIQRALTAGPGQYRLSVAWVDAAAKPGKAPVHVAHRTLDLPPAWADEFRISSVVVAESVTVRETPYTAIEQRAHPYSLGVTEIRPVRDTVFANSDALSLAFQVINAQTPNTGKPDVTVNFRITRQAGNREEQVATLTPLRYDATTLPPDFDVRLGHPLIAAMSVPLATLTRGAYRLHIAATDHVTTSTTHSAVEFSVIGTPLSLLTEAPPLGRRFRREDAIEDSVLAALVLAFTPASPSPALGRALDLAARRTFVDLLAAETVPQGEQATRTALTGLALYAMGDVSALTQFQQAYALGGPGGPIQFLIGAVRATQGRDPDAIEAWQSARDEGLNVAAPFLVEAYLRRQDGARASALVSAELAGRPAEGTWARALAAAHLAGGRNQEALAVLEAQLAQTPDDLDKRWLQLQALFGRVVRDGADVRARFTDLAKAYIAAGGTHAELAAEWVKAVP